MYEAGPVRLVPWVDLSLQPPPLALLLQCVYERDESVHVLRRDPSDLLTVDVHDVTAWGHTDHGTYSTA